ncbi:phosphopantetheine-binding protein [Streptomyces sp. 8N706]|uniref:phosphopantetheine-binding protein n=1 Tax=Streptomyces sp. 8N706 TaxID=3457416 RepID=UPI003FD29B80
MQSIRTDIIDILVRHLPYAKDVDDWADAELAALGLDSMTAIDLVLDIEQAMDVVFTDETLVAETFATATSLQDVVAQLEAAR